MSAYTFPTLTHQYAPLFYPSRVYFAGNIVRTVVGAEWNAYKFVKDAAANEITELNWQDYVVLLPKLSLPMPSRPFKEGLKANTLVYSADSGHEQRREKSPPKKTFELAWNALLHDHYITIRDFYMVVLNSQPFLWVHPLDKSNNLVRFANEVFQGENFAHGPQGPIYKLQLSLLQVWA